MEFRPLFKAEQIARRVRELGKEISRDYRGQSVDLLGILDNAFVFVADLLRHIEVPVRCQFIRAEFRDFRDAEGHERKEIFYTPEFDGAGKNVLLVEGVLTSGITMDFLIKRIGLRQPKSVKTVVFIDKTGERRLPLEPDYYAFRLESSPPVVGYGLAWDGFYRNLPYVGVPAGTKAAPTGAPHRRPATKSLRKARRR